MEGSVQQALEDCYGGLLHWQVICLSLPAGKLQIRNILAMFPAL